ncbi:MAG: biotin-dependent carboxyltransferase family protein [Pseudomonadota bacterium]
MTLLVKQAGPLVSLQDAGRPGGLGLGLSRGGAVDRQGYLAACALADASLGAAAIEMAGFGGRFEFETPSRFALAGATMRATLDGAPLLWNAVHLAEPGAVLDIGAAEQGVYGYLLPGGGVMTEPELGGRGFHRIAGLGRPIHSGDRLPIGPSHDESPMKLNDVPAPSGPIRVMPGPQSALFDEKVKQRFAATVFTRSAKANRQGARLEQDGAPFSAGSQLQQVSDFISEGDIQMTGDGTPYVLLADCQTMGGYPRIGTVIPADVPRIAQALPGENMRFAFITEGEAASLWQSDEARLMQLKGRLQPLVRDPREMSDLLSYNLISKPVGLDGG